MCFTWISEQTAIISLQSINLSVFISEAESVFCAVRTGSLNQTDTVSYLKGKTKLPSIVRFIYLNFPEGDRSSPDITWSISAQLPVTVHCNWSNHENSWL